MQFSESQLVDLFLAEDHLVSRFPFVEHGKVKGLHRYRTRRERELSHYREYKLKSGRRCDLLAIAHAALHPTPRLFWVIEFKVEAGVDALIQVCEYYDQLAQEFRQMTAIFAGAKAVAAQFFHPHVIELAPRLGVSCLHLAPINSKSMTVEELSYPGRDKLLVVNNAKIYCPPEAVNG